MKSIFLALAIGLFGCGNSDTNNPDKPNPNCQIPVATTGPDMDLIYGFSFPKSVKLGAPAKEGVTYSWSPASFLSDATKADPIATPQCTTKYTLTAANSCGKNSASVTIHVFVETFGRAQREVRCR